MQRGLPRIRRCKSSRGSKSPSQSVCLVTQSRSTTPRSLATFFYSGLVNSFSFPLCTRSSATGPWDRAHGLSLASQYRSVCQCAVFSGLGGQPRLGCSSVSHIAPQAAFGSGESSGVSTGPSAYITSTLGPFVLSDPGLLSRFQTGSNTSCGGNVQGDTVAEPMCEAMCGLERWFVR